MTDELKQWEYDRGYDKGRAEREEEIVDLIYLFEKTWNKESHKRVPHKAISELIEFIYQTDTKERVAEQKIPKWKLDLEEKGIVKFGYLKKGVKHEKN